VADGGAAGLAASGLAASDLALSAIAACWIGWVVCACAETIQAGASNSAATNAVFARKGLKQRINSESSILLGRIEMRGVDHEFR
jgi:hypothetical protein